MLKFAILILIILNLSDDMLLVVVEHLSSVRKGGSLQILSQKLLVCGIQVGRLLVRLLPKGRRSLFSSFLHKVIK